MSEQGYRPGDEDLWQAREAYIRYAVGVAILHDPLKTQGIHGYHVDTMDTEEDRKPIIFHAEEIMLAGLQDVIRYAHPQEDRTNLSILEGRYLSALPNLQTIVDCVYAEEFVRLGELSPTFLALHPAPMTKEVIYKYLCHGRPGKIKTTELLDGVSAHATFAEMIRGRTLSARQNEP